jgi:hypothetical protein
MLYLGPAHSGFRVDPNSETGGLTSDWLKINHIDVEFILLTKFFNESPPRHTIQKVYRTLSDKCSFQTSKLVRKETRLQ